MTGGLLDLRNRKSKQKTKMDQPPSVTNGGPGPEIDTTSFWDWLSAAAAFNPCASAIQSVRQPTQHLDFLPVRSRLSNLNEEAPSTPFTWTYADLNDHATRLASCLYVRGLRAGDHLLVVLKTTPEWALFFWASARLGTIFIPLPPPSLGNDVLWQYFLAFFEPAAVVVQDVESALLADQHLGAQPSLRVKLICQPPSTTTPATTPSKTEAAGNLHAWDYLPTISRVSDSTLLPPAPPCALQHINQIVFTSGSSGLPKPCPRTNGLVKSQIAQYLSMPAFSWSTTTRYLWLTPSFMVIGLISALCTWRSGGCVVFRPNRWTDPVPVLEDIERMRITHIWTIASRLVVLAEAVERTRSMGSLQVVTSSGECNPRRSLSFVREKFRLPRVLSLWGMSEGCSHIGWLAGPPTEDEYPVATPAEIMAVGKAMPGASIKIVSRHQTASPSGQPPDPSIVPRNVVGALHVTSPTIINNYLGSAQSQNFYSDDTGRRWFKTGDLALMNGEGCIFILGRVTEPIDMKEGTVIPAVADAILSDFFGMKAVVAELPKSCSTTSKGGPAYVTVVKMEQEDINAHVSEGRVQLEEALGAGLLPRDFIALRRLAGDGAWPMTATGKINRKGIAEAVLAFYIQNNLNEARPIVYA